jgi:hypothetical protein
MNHRAMIRNNSVLVILVISNLVKVCETENLIFCYIIIFLGGDPSAGSPTDTL